MLKAYLKRNQGFTLVELLIVIAIIAILAVVILVTINPAAAQARARDTQRFKDIANMQSIIEQYLSDNLSTASSLDVTSLGGTNNCGTGGWIGVDMCPYANTLSIDPANRTTIYATTGGQGTGGVGYEIHLDSSAQYRICVRLESASNRAKLSNDGVINDYFEVFSNTSAPACGS